jgi:hypothetical protein
VAGWTNRGKFNVLGVTFRGSTIPGSGFAVFLATAAVTPNPDFDLKTSLTEIATGNGYSAGGINVARNATDWDVLTESDASDVAFIQIKDLAWTASGGPIPASGSPARYAGLTDQHATLSSRELWAWWDLGGDQSVPNGFTLKLIDCELRLTE